MIRAQLSIIACFLICLFASLLKAEFVPSKIIGNNDLIAVKKSLGGIPQDYHNLIDAIGWTNYGCTVTHIGNGYAITAGHCFDATDTFQENKSCQFANIKWGRLHDRKESLESKCEMILGLQKNDSTDFAILKVNPIPTTSVRLDLDNLLTVGSEISIFSYPDSQPLYWSQYCDIDPRFLSPLPTGYILYKCDTNPGSSGAALIDKTTGFIVGIHRGGIETTNYGSNLLHENLKNLLLRLGF